MEKAQKEEVRAAIGAFIVPVGYWVFDKGWDVFMSPDYAWPIVAALWIASGSVWIGAFLLAKPWVHENIVPLLKSQYKTWKNRHIPPSILPTRHVEQEPQGEEGSQQLEQKLSRIEFLQDQNNTVSEVRFLVRLDRQYTPDELGHFRILLEVIDMSSADPHPTLWVAARDAYPVWHSGNQATKLDGIRSIVWSRNPDEQLQNTVIGAAVGPRICDLLAWGSINRRGPFQTLRAFDNKWLNIYITRPLVSKVSYIGFAADDYLLFGLMTNRLETINGSPLIEWPHDLTEDEQSLGWSNFHANRYWPNDESRPPLRPPLGISFGRYTPTKLQPLGPFKAWPSLQVPEQEFSEIWPPT